MTLNDWIISFGIALIGIILTVAGYFIQNWIQGVDETLKENSNELKALSWKVSRIEDFQQVQTHDITQAIKDYISAEKPSYQEVDRIDKEVSLIKQTLQRKVLPAMSNSEVHLGRIIILEDTAEKQDKKLKTMYDIVNTIAGRKKPDQK